MATSIEGLWVAFMVASTFGSLIKLDFLWWYMGLTAAMHLTAQEMKFAEHDAVRQAAIDARRQAWRTRGLSGDPQEGQKVRS